MEKTGFETLEKKKKAKNLHYGTSFSSSDTLDWRMFNFNDNICTQSLLWFVWHHPSLKAKREGKVHISVRNISTFDETKRILDLTVQWLAIENQQSSFHVVNDLQQVLM